MQIFFQGKLYQLTHRTFFLCSVFFQQSYKAFLYCNTYMFFHNTKVLQFFDTVKNYTLSYLYRTTSVKEPALDCGQKIDSSVNHREYLIVDSFQ